MSHKNFFKLDDKILSTFLDELVGHLHIFCKVFKSFAIFNWVVCLFIFDL